MQCVLLLALAHHWSFESSLQGLSFTKSFLPFRWCLWLRTVAGDMLGDMHFLFHMMQSQILEYILSTCSIRKPQTDLNKYCSHDVHMYFEKVLLHFFRQIGLCIYISRMYSFLCAQCIGSSKNVFVCYMPWPDTSICISFHLPPSMCAWYLGGWFFPKQVCLWGL